MSNKYTIMIFHFHLNIYHCFVFSMFILPIKFAEKLYYKKTSAIKYKQYSNNYMK